MCFVISQAVTTGLVLVAKVWLEHWFFLLSFVVGYAFLGVLRFSAHRAQNLHFQGFAGDLSEPKMCHEWFEDKQFRWAVTVRV